MINVSNAFKELLLSDKRIYKVKLKITLADNTVLEDVTEKDLWTSSFKITDGTSELTSFDVGSAIINKLNFAINNIYNTYSEYDFNGSKVVCQIGLTLPDNTTEYINKGVFTVYEQPAYNGSLISFVCCDGMYKFNKLITSISGNTMGEVVTNICGAVGINLNTLQFDGYDLAITLPGDVTKMTYRQLLSYICMLTGNFARINVDGELEIKWYDTDFYSSETNLDGGTFKTTTTPYSDGDTADGGNFTDYSSGVTADGGTFIALSTFHHIYSMSDQSFSTDDVVISGIKIVDSDQVAHTIGTDSYMISIENNPLVTVDNIQTYLTFLGNKIIGMRFRKFSISCLSDPTIEPGDNVKISDNKGNVYLSFINNSVFTIGNYQTVSCNAESPLQNSSQALSAETQNIVNSRRVAEKKITSYDLQVKQMTDLIANGFGVFKTEVIDDNGGVIYYTHDKKIMSESSVRWFTTSEGTIEQNNINGTWVTVSAGDKSGNALVKVLTAIGILAEWINTRNFLAKDNNDNMTFNIDENGKVHIAAEEFSLQGKSIPASVNIASVNLLKNTAYNSLLPTAFSTRGGYAATVSTEVMTFGDISSVKIVASVVGIYGLKDFSQKIDGQLEVGKNLMLGLYASSSIPAMGHAVIEGASTTNQIISFEVSATTWGNRQILDFGTVQNTGTYGNVKVTVWFDQVGTYYLACPMLAYGNTLGEWQLAISDVSANASAQADAVMTQTKVFNTLTNNGAIQGLFMKDGQLYVNMSYLQSGIIKVGGLNNGNGLIDVYDDSGRLITQIDKNGTKSYCYSDNYVTQEITYDNGAGTIFKTKLFGTGISTPSIKAQDASDSNNYSYLTHNGLAIWKNATNTFNLSNDGDMELKSVFTLDGANGSFTSADGKTITVSGGIVTDISLG